MMWMMGYNDGVGEFNTIQDPFTGRKLRPLMPRPVPAAANAAAANASTNLPCLSRVDHFLGINHHHLAMVEQNKRELATQQVVVSTRWNPTPEQLQTLEELYRRGTRTPTAEQIQQITAQLRRYGKIEGKNVFYWFQNHKARERQKRRRQVEPISDDQQQQQQPDNNNNNYNNKIEKEEKPPGSNRTAFEVEQTKNWASPTNSSTIPQKTTQGGTKGADQAECKADGWLQFDDAAAASEILLQQQQRRRRRNATWQMMHLSPSSTVSTSSHSPPLSSSSSPSPSPSPTNPIINNNHHHHHHYNPIPPNTMYHDVTIPLMDHHHHHHFINIFNNLEHYRDSAGDDDDEEDEAAQTLELFPLQSGQGLNDEECGPMSHAPAYQFFEFLPMKN